MSDDPENPALRPTDNYDEVAINRARELLTAMPENVGPYRILERIGGGGMGDVYRAEQRSPIRRQVALKFIKLGMDSKAVLARFEAERQALALMDHPHIAKVFDAGTDDTGRPYFVMEYVKGKPITEYADQNHLTIAERLELFEQVCQAIQHAHHKGVIHRDLKPGNVLVSTQDGEPYAKVIDFGIAKAISQKLTDETLFTQHDQFVGTPQYMSPEQAEGSVDIDTRTDVYSLGVLLYELLTGSTPFSTNDIKAAAFEQMKKLIIEVDPPKPSTRLTPNTPTLTTLAAFRRIEPKRLGNLVRGELDWIVMKSIEKDRRRRYETPTSLANDILAHLKGEPVKAAPPSSAYRIQKFIKKHRGPVIAASSVLIALLLGIVGTTYGYLLADRFAKSERDARLEADNEREAANVARENEANQRQLAEASQKTAEEQRQLESAARKQAELNGDLARRHLYASHMNLAQKAWDDNRVGETVRLLELYRPTVDEEGGSNDFRGFEWYYLDRLSHTDLATLNLATMKIDAHSRFKFIFEGKWLATSNGATSVQVWHAATTDQTTYQRSLNLKQSLNLMGHTSFVMCAAVSRDGKHLATAGHDKIVKVWDAGTGACVLTLTGHSNTVNGVTYRPDGRQLATASSDHTVKVWDVLSGKELFDLAHSNSVQSVAYSPGGTRLVSAGWSDMKFWDSDTGEMLLSVVSAPIMSVVYSPDGTRLATANRDHTVNVMHAMTGEKLHVLKGHSDVVTCVAYSPDGLFLASASEDQTVKMWDSSNGQEILTLKGHTDKVDVVAFSSDGQWVTSVSRDGTVKLWNVTTNYEPYKFEEVYAHYSGIAYSPDGTRLATVLDATDAVALWDSTSGDLLLTLKGHSATVTCIAYSSDGQRLATSSYDKTIKVWDAITGSELFTLAGHTDMVRRVTFSPDGKKLASSGDDEMLKVWDAITGHQLFHLKTKDTASYRSASCVSFSPDSRRLASSFGSDSDAGYGVKVWDSNTGNALLTLEGHKGTIEDLAYSPEGDRVATASKDKTVKIWDASSGQELLTLIGHTGPIVSVAYSPDGRRLATASEDQTVKVWDARIGDLLLTLKGHTSGVVFCPDGMRLASFFDDAVTEWDTRKGEESLERASRRSGRRARTVVEEHVSNEGSEAQLLEAIRNDRGITNIARRDALQFVELVALQHDEGMDSETLWLRVAALLAYATAATDDVPAAIRKKWSAGSLPVILFREATQTAAKCLTFDPLSENDYSNAVVSLSLCRDAIERIDISDKEGLKAELQDIALKGVKTAISKGWLDAEKMASDTGLEPLRELPEFKAMLEDLRAKPKSQ